MNTKIALGVLTVFVIVSAYLLLNNTSTQQSTAQPTTQPIPTQTIATPTPEATQANETIVEVTDEGFLPASLTIKKGTKIVWINRTDNPVTVNSDPHPIHTLYSKLNLGSFITSKTVQLIFDEPGTYKYHNHLEASMTGTIIVE